MSPPVDARILLAEGLRERRSELARRLGRISADRRHSDQPLSADFEEQAVERENDEVLDGLSDLERRELEDIDTAIRRIDAGCFGICDDCGDDIDPVRLNVQPAAATCIRCAERREKADRA